jgi:hypothetical protein
VSEMKRPSKAEEEYFAREEIKRKEQAKIKLSHEEREHLKQMHWMRCPKCGHPLVEVLFRDQTIDRCMHCRGVFLESGELEHLAGHEGNVLSAILDIFRKE